MFTAKQIATVSETSAVFELTNSPDLGYTLDKDGHATMAPIKFVASHTRDGSTLLVESDKKGNCVAWGHLDTSLVKGTAKDSLEALGAKVK